MEPTDRAVPGPFDRKFVERLLHIQNEIHDRTIRGTGNALYVVEGSKLHLAIERGELAADGLPPGQPVRKQDGFAVYLAEAFTGMEKKQPVCRWALHPIVEQDKVVGHQVLLRLGRSEEYIQVTEDQARALKSMFLTERNMTGEEFEEGVQP